MEPSQRCIVNILLLWNRALYIFLYQASGDTEHLTYMPISRQCYYRLSIHIPTSYLIWNIALVISKYQSLTRSRYKLSEHFRIGCHLVPLESLALMRIISNIVKNGWRSKEDATLSIRPFPSAHCFIPVQMPIGRRLRSNVTLSIRSYPLAHCETLLLMLRFDADA